MEGIYYDKESIATAIQGGLTVEDDIPAWSKNAGHTLLKTEQDEKLIKFWIKKN